MFTESNVKAREFCDKLVEPAKNSLYKCYKLHVVLFGLKLEIFRPLNKKINKVHRVVNLLVNEYQSLEAKI